MAIKGGFFQLQLVEEILPQQLLVRIVAFSVLVDKLVVFFRSKGKVDDGRDVGEFDEDRSEYFRGKELHS